MIYWFIQHAYIPNDLAIILTNQLKYCLVWTEWLQIFMFFSSINSSLPWLVSANTWKGIIFRKVFDCLTKFASFSLHKYHQNFVSNVVSDTEHRLHKYLPKRQSSVGRHSSRLRDAPIVCNNYTENSLFSEFTVLVLKNYIFSFFYEQPFYRLPFLLRL